MTDVACAGCGRALDPLRAGHVAIFDERFAYFCDRQCRQREAAQRSPCSEGGGVAPHPIEPLTREDPPLFHEGRGGSAQRQRPSGAPSSRRQPAALALRAHPLGPLTREGPSPPWTPHPRGERGNCSTSETNGSDASRRQPWAPALPAAASGPRPASSNDAGSLLLWVAGGAGMLTIAFVLIGTSTSVIAARAVIALVGAVALAGHRFVVNRDWAQEHAAALLAAPFLTACVALGALVKHDRAAAEATSLAGVIVASSALLVALYQRAGAEIEAERRWVQAALALPGRRVTPADSAFATAYELRPGEEIEVQAGEIVPADILVTKGQCLALPWLGAMTPVTKSEGAPLVAGARIVEGSVRGTTSWIGHDRAWARLLLDPARRVDIHSTICKMAHAIAEGGAVVAAALAAFASFANSGRIVDVALPALAAHAALATPAVVRVTALLSMRGVLAAVRRGITYKEPAAWDEASRTAVAVFCSRGTLLLGEPDVVEVEPYGHHTAKQVLAWSAGAETGQNHPTAIATVRAARHKAVEPDAVRSPHEVPGLGVVAVTSTGESLLVGSRALMLEERISIALGEGRVAELEGLGRTVLLVAVAGRLAGLVALQDGLRPGARASIQHLLDIDVEPVLLSGESRETCEAVARSLAIDHIRPEVLPADCANEVRRLAEGGAKVAVIGRPITDSAALGAADISIALGAAGATPNEWSIALASDDARDAALALAIAHRTQSEAKMALILAVAPGVIGALSVAFGLLPPVFAPLAGLVGGIVTLLHARGVMSARREAPVMPWDLPLPTRRASL